MSKQPFDSLPTPCLVVDKTQMHNNIARMNARISALGPVLRPHLKTAKSIEIAREMMASASGPATVSTLKEAEVFARAGVNDMIYAVGITQNKLSRIIALRQQGIDIAVLLDSDIQAHWVADASRQAGISIPAFIEIDTDGHRAGVKPDDAALLKQIGAALEHGGATLRGVLTHAGGSYGAQGDAALTAFAEQERKGAVDAAEHLRQAGFDCPVVSIGSTPTALFSKDMSGVTEVRAGVYVFFDLVMAGLGVCKPEDIALSVLTTVIGHQADKGWILIDAGWMALSRDRGTAGQAVDQGYGLVCDAEGNVIGDLIVSQANQEHGVVSLRADSAGTLPDIPVGTLLRILPNHACATAAQHDSYYVTDGSSQHAIAHWPRFGGW